MSKKAACNPNVARRMMRLVPPPALFAACVETDSVVAIGRACLDRATVGLFDIATAVEHRRRGLAEKVTTALLAWGRRRGATSAYLQVESDHLPALRLYDKLGFRESHTYWYRVSPVTPGS